MNRFLRFSWTNLVSFCLILVSPPWSAMAQRQFGSCPDMHAGWRFPQRNQSESRYTEIWYVPLKKGAKLDSINLEKTRDTLVLKKLHHTHPHFYCTFILSDPGSASARKCHVPFGKPGHGTDWYEAVDGSDLILPDTKGNLRRVWVNFERNRYYKPREIISCKRKYYQSFHISNGFGLVHPDRTSSDLPYLIFVRFNQVQLEVINRESVNF